MEGLWNFPQENPLLVWGFAELLCGSLGDKNVEGNAEDGGLACEVSEQSLKTLLGPFVILIEDPMVLVLWG